VLVPLFPHITTILMVVGLLIVLARIYLFLPGRAAKDSNLEVGVAIFENCSWAMIWSQIPRGGKSFEWRRWKNAIGEFANAF
jgi:hypothetical protein